MAEEYTDFYKVNREERHLGTLLAASVIYDKDFRNSFFDEINDALKLPGFLDKEGAFDIYSEVALFRDFWDAQKKEGNADDNHKKFLKTLLPLLQKTTGDSTGTDAEVLEKSKTVLENIQSPGNWKKIETLPLPLKAMHWLFTAKPDMLIMSGNSGLLIELKLESDFGTDENGYDQLKTLQHIVEVAPKTVLKEKTLGKLVIMSGEKYDRKEKARQNRTDLKIPWDVLQKEINPMIRWEDLKPSFAKLENSMVRKHIFAMLYNEDVA